MNSSGSPNNSSSRIFKAKPKRIHRDKEVFQMRTMNENDASTNSKSESTEKK
jgi:hypothetical protein